MAAAPRETVVTEGYLASVPAAVRRALGIEPGDRLLWEVQGKAIRVRVRKARRRAFADFVPFDFGAPTDAQEEHDEVF